MEGKTLVFKPVKQCKLNPNKIQTLDDVIAILKRVSIYTNSEETLEGIEHLIEKDDE
ncbi:hypothetical protein [Bacillus sp. FDAARGOS_1420]|uniref:hypothetical protein n=1 Tax=Bacillus sp. FDAARGOS_1420 TaxID=2856338 RepID=UPI001C5BEF42|nr:hypothetical protein [Bacillus sp. FDAARGOS_1420]MBW3491834.1 hypothetical protein [Bacillus sp. FDAARGOS_1420]MBW3492054.1 hypothetical protein [Bacillus sp. FDAARGOS_1420]